MSGIGNVNNTLVQSQLENAAILEQIAYRVAVKTMDAAKDQGEQIVSLIEGAAEVAEQQSPSLNSLASGLGLNLDLKA